MLLSPSMDDEMVTAFLIHHGPLRGLDLASRLTGRMDTRVSWFD